MFYSAEIKLPSGEIVTVEGVGEFKLTAAINAVFEKAGMRSMSRMDLSRILCNSKDKSCRVMELEKILNIKKKRVRVLCVANPDPDNIVLLHTTNARKYNKKMSNEPVCVC